MPIETPDRRVSLREITQDTVREVCKLVAEPTGFVAPNAVSIAQAYFHPEAWFRAVCADDEIVGFVMIEDSSLKPQVQPSPPAELQVGLWRFMIDVKHKRKGYGRAALRLVIAEVQGRHPGLKRFATSCVKAPGTPRPFYESLGFVFSGEMDGDEEVGWLALPA